MSRLLTVLRELLGLFVDNVGFAVAILVWLGIVWVVFIHARLAPAWAPLILFVGLAIILAESALRRARET